MTLSMKKKRFKELRLSNSPLLTLSLTVNTIDTANGINIPENNV